MLTSSLLCCFDLYHSNFRFKKEELKLDEKMYGTRQNKKIVAWMINRKKHFNEKERQAFFKRLNPQMKQNQDTSNIDFNQPIYNEVRFY